MKENIFNELIGEQLSSVIFVQDYLQIDFDGNRITLFVWPAVYSNGRYWKISDKEFRNEICGLIAKIVKATQFHEKELLELTFADDTKISIPLNEDNPEINGPEILNYTNVNQEWVVI